MAHAPWARICRPHSFLWLSSAIHYLLPCSETLIMQLYTAWSYRYPQFKLQEENISISLGTVSDSINFLMIAAIRASMINCTNCQPVSAYFWLRSLILIGAFFRIVLLNVKDAHGFRGSTSFYSSDAMNWRFGNMLSISQALPHVSYFFLPKFRVSGWICWELATRTLTALASCYSKVSRPEARHEQLNQNIL